MVDQLPNPFRREGGEGRRSQPLPGVSPKDWSRLYVMVVVFMICVGGAIYALKSMEARKLREEGLPEGRVEYSLQSVPSPPPELPKQRAEIPLPPLPREGGVNFKELAAPFRDGREKPVKETPEFIQILRVLNGVVTPAELSKRVHPALSADAAYREPERHRGEVLRIYGRLICIYPEPLETPTPGNTGIVHLAIMQEYPKNRTIYSYLTDLPKDPATGKPLAFKTHPWEGRTIYDDWVEVDGVFLRTFDYPGQKATEAQQRDPWVKSVMLLAKNLRIVEKPRLRNAREGLMAVSIVGAAIVLTIVLVAAVMSRRQVRP